MGPGDGWQHRRILLSYRHAQEVGHRRRDVLFDLIRALPAAVLVGVVPGWFWAKLLVASADRAERFAYSVGLSVALVPAVILIPARLFGTGVTLAVAVASPLVVFFLGLAAYLRFGPAKGSDEPLAPPPASPGLPALVLLIAAFALALGILLGAVPGGWAAVLVAPLALSAGIVHLLVSRRGYTPRAGVRDPGSPVVPTLRYAALSVVLLLVLL